MSEMDTLLIIGEIAYCYLNMPLNAAWVISYFFRRWPYYFVRFVSVFVCNINKTKGHKSRKNRSAPLLLSRVRRRLRHSQITSRIPVPIRTPTTMTTMAMNQSPASRKRSAWTDCVVSCKVVVSPAGHPLCLQAILLGPCSKHGSMQSLTSLS